MPDKLVVKVIPSGGYNDEQVIQDALDKVDLLQQIMAWTETLNKEVEDA